MCYRILSFLFAVAAGLSALAVFLPWQRLFLLTDEQATRWLAAKLLVLPLFAVCVIASMWAARRARS